MKIKISTVVEQNIHNVFAQFDEQIFLELAPPLMPGKLTRFDGCKLNDEVHLDFPFGQRWISVIRATEIGEKMIFFVDEGLELPFPLKTWKHFHRILDYNGGAIIEDEIHFQTNNFIINFLVYPLFWLVFAYRKIIYKKKFAV